MAGPTLLRSMKLSKLGLPCSYATRVLADEVFEQNGNGFTLSVLESLTRDFQVD